MKVIATGFVAMLMLAPLGVSAQTAITDDQQMTLYTFDRDTDGISACYDTCAENWPPYLGEDAAEKGEGWTLVERTDGSQQWAYNGMPLYYYIEDKNPGDALGDGKADGTWHVLME